MREKKDFLVLTFRTTTEAMAMEKQCAEKGIAGRLIPIPSEITAGCGLAWRILPSDYERYKDDIGKLGIDFEQTVSIRLR